MPAKSRAQQQLFGIARRIQKGGRAGAKAKAGPAAKRIAKKVSKKSVKKFASTKHKGLPKHKKAKK